MEKREEVDVKKKNCKKERENEQRTNEGKKHFPQIIIEKEGWGELEEEQEKKREAVKKLEDKSQNNRDGERNRIKDKSQGSCI